MGEQANHGEDFSGTNARDTGNLQFYGTTDLFVKIALTGRICDSCVR